MPVYRFYEFAEDGRCKRFADHECADDAGAIAFAHRLPNPFGMEVWLRDGGRVERLLPSPGEDTGHNIRDEE